MASVSAKKNDVRTSTPRITLGLYYLPNDKYTLNFSATGIWQHIDTQCLYHVLYSFCFYNLALER